MNYRITSRGVLRVYLFIYLFIFFWGGINCESYIGWIDVGLASRGI